MGKRKKIVDYIEGLIRDGKIRKGDKIPSEYALSEMFSVNTKTANLAVNTLVASGFLKRLSGAAGTIVVKEVFYPKGVLTYLICLDHDYSYWAKLIKGAQAAALARGYALQYIECHADDVKDTLVKLEGFGIKGLLTTSYGLIDSSPSFPVVHVDYLPPEDGSYNYVTSDNFTAGYLAGKYLLDLKHKEIVFAIKAANINSGIMKERMRGFIRALGDAGITDAKDRIFCNGFNSAAAVKEMRARYPGVTGMVFASDILAIRMLDFLLKDGFKIPDDLSIIGCGGTLTKSMPAMRISSIEQFPEDMGFYACNALADIIEEKRTSLITEKLPVEVFRGDSTGALRQ